MAYGDSDSLSRLFNDSAGPSFTIPHNSGEADPDDAYTPETPLDLHQWAKWMTGQVAEAREYLRSSSPALAAQSIESLDINLSQLDAATWAFVINAGLLELSLDMIFDGDFCGSPEAMVHTWKDSSQKGEVRSRMRYAARVVNIYGQCCCCLYSFVVHGPAGEWYSECISGIERAAQVAIKNNSRFWQLAYRFRKSLIAMSGSCPIASIPGNPDTINAQLVGIASHIAQVQVGLYIPFVQTPVDQELVLLLLWVYCSKDTPDTSLLALLALELLLLGGGGGEERRSLFCRQAISDVTTPHEIHRCFCRHYKREIASNHHLRTLFWAHGFISSELQKMRIKVLDYTTLPYAVAAFRRQLCRGESELLTGEVLRMMLRYLTVPLAEYSADTTLVLSERLAHAMTVISGATFSCLILLADSRSHAEERNNLRSVIEACTRTFIAKQNSESSSRPRTRPASLALSMLRQHTLRHCKAVLKDVQARSISGYGQWRLLVVRWRGLISALPRPTHEGHMEDTILRVTLTKRCAWKECCCSVYKPAHHMRVCTGCHAVAYCGEKCREKDWVEGGHNSRCRRLNRSRA